MTVTRRKSLNPPSSTGLLNDVPISTCQIAADVRNDMRAIATIENTTLVEYVDAVLRKFIRSYQAPPSLKLQSTKRNKDA